MDRLIETQPWIESDKKYFGNAGTQYDFKDIEPIKLEEDIKKLEEEKEELSKRINPAISEMFEKTNKWQNDVLSKRAIAQQNKDQLEKAIQELDIEKNRDVRNTVKEVDKHFNDIFSVLLPGTKTRLE